MNKESKLNLNAGDYAISHCDSNKTYNGLEVHKMLCDAYIAGNNDTLDDKDEEIRKALINVFATHKDYEMFFGVSVKDIRAWLEEQGEKSNWKPSNEEMDVLYGLAYITNQYDEHKEEVITRLYKDLKREFFNGSSYENMFPNTEDDVRRRSTIQVLEYARSLDTYNQYGKADINKNIAWLGKQGEPIEINPTEFDTRLQTLIGKFDNLPKEELIGSLSFWLNVVQNDGTYKDEEKQDEKKHADKVEPKFKVGDWITNGDYTWKIVEVKPLDYVLQSQDGNIVDDTISHVDEQFHSFTIEDAKDGDVLCLYYNNRKTFFIFKAIIGEGDYSDILVHCCYTGKYQYLEPSFNGECRMHQISDGGYCLPADKEEQGILFQKMKKAGYGWDAEKKELKKIEQKSQRMISAEAKEAMYDKPAWSEEDKDFMYDTLSNLTELKDRYGEGYGNVGKCIDWLKSLKKE